MKNMLIVSSLTLVTVVVYVVSYSFFWEIGLHVVGDVKRDLSWGLTLRYSILVFAVLTLLSNSIIVLLNAFSVLKIASVYLVSLFFLFLFFIDSIFISPLRVCLLIFCSFFAYFLSTILLVKFFIKKLS